MKSTLPNPASPQCPDAAVGSQARLLSREELMLRKRLRSPLHYKTSLWAYVRHPRPLVVLSAPLLYGCAIPFVFLDLFIEVFQTVCFPIYGIPRVHRQDHFVFDRGLLPYLNALERVNCFYCSYVNGLIGYVAEITGRTEQHWCPIKHSRAARSAHSRYRKFLAFGDAPAYRKRIQSLRGDFSDLAPGGKTAVAIPVSVRAGHLDDPDPNP